jgi:hypothetical protein
MTKERRTAMARVISDMIKDIEESEINDMKKLMSEYSIPCMTRSEFTLRQRWQCQLHYFAIFAWQCCYIIQSLQQEITNNYIFYK